MPQAPDKTSSISTENIKSSDTALEVSYSPAKKDMRNPKAELWTEQTMQSNTQ